MPNDIEWTDKADLPQVTLRSTIAGLLIGSIILVSNFQFGLQTGWVSMMSLPSALLGFAVFKSLQKRLSYQFTDVENVYVQSVSVAVATGPLAYGFVGIIPAIEKLMTDEESGYANGLDMKPLWKLVMWSAGVAFFGVFFAIPLRKQFVIKEKLPFPSGSATATLISVFHGTSLKLDEDPNEENQVPVPVRSSPVQGSVDSVDSVDPDDYGTDAESRYQPTEEQALTSVEHPLDEMEGIRPTRSDMTIIESGDLCESTQLHEYHSNLRLLAQTSGVAAVYTVVSYFIPQIRAIPIFGRKLSNEYLINFQPSPAYIGQGIIMGLQTTAYMLVGAFLGWFILSPISKWTGWAPGPTDNWKTGSEGWIMWISLSIMISDSVVSLLVISLRALVRYVDEYYSRPPQLHPEVSRLMDQTRDGYESSSSEHTTPKEDCAPVLDADGNPQDVGRCHLVPKEVVVGGIILSTVLCLATTRVVFGYIIPYYATGFSVLLSLLLSLLGVKALGETDLNPVSGIGKISQLICAVLIPQGTPGAILINLISGGISEATTQQAGDLMQDLKTGYLLGASPRAQFSAQVIGSIYSILLSSVMYKVYNSLYEIPGKMFKIPTAVIWIDCARLVNGSGLPPYALTFSIVFGVIFGLISLAKNLIEPHHKYYKYMHYLPDGVPVGIGIYNIPSFTFARFIGGLVSYYWLKREGSCDKHHSGRVRMIIFSSGLVLGEGLFSVVNMILASVGVPHI